MSTDFACNDTPNEPPGDGTVNGIEVIWRQGDSHTVLATIDSTSDGRAVATITVPHTATPGAATIRVGPSGPATVTVEE